MTIGQLIKYHRRRQMPVMTQEDLAIQIGSNEQYIHKVEGGKTNPRYDFAIKVLKHLGVGTKHPLMEV